MATTEGAFQNRRCFGTVIVLLHFNLALIYLSIPLYKRSVACGVNCRSKRTFSDAYPSTPLPHHPHQPGNTTTLNIKPSRNLMNTRPLGERSHAWGRTRRLIEHRWANPFWCLGNCALRRSAWLCECQGSATCVWHKRGLSTLFSRFRFKCHFLWAPRSQWCEEIIRLFQWRWKAMTTLYSFSCVMYLADVSWERRSHLNMRENTFVFNFLALYHQPGGSQLLGQLYQAWLDRVRRV